MKSVINPMIQFWHNSHNFRWLSLIELTQYVTISFGNLKHIKFARKMFVKQKMREALESEKLKILSKLWQLNCSGNSFMVNLYGQNGCETNIVKTLMFGLQTQMIMHRILGNSCSKLDNGAKLQLVEK